MFHWEENSPSLLFYMVSVHGLFYRSFLLYNSLPFAGIAIRMCSWVSCFYSPKLFHELCWSSVLEYCCRKSNFPHYKVLQTGSCIFSWVVQMNLQFHLIWTLPQLIWLAYLWNHEILSLEIFISLLISDRWIFQCREMGTYYLKPSTLLACSDYHIWCGRWPNYSDRLVSAVPYCAFLYVMFYLLSKWQEGMGLDHHLLVCLAVNL